MTVELKDFELTASLSDSEKAAVCDQLELLELDPGEVLFQEGSESDGMWLLETGSLGLGSNRAGDLGRLSAGSTLGAMALTLTGPRELSATAREDARVWLLSREAFRRLAIDEPHAALRILEAAVLEFGTAARGGLDQLANAVSPNED
ncbi:MAG: cyclic nucleotide-binding domain-containing protein [Myxococcales bacterium]|nr:cyclic nucleotide-binding domain-containing protein [Myxococcales bacterium]